MTKGQARVWESGPGISLILIMQRSLVISNGLRHSTLRHSDQSHVSSGSRDLGQPIVSQDTLLISKSHRVELSILPKLFSHWNSFLNTKSNLNRIDLIKLMIVVIVLDFTICWVFLRGVYRMGINDGGPPTIYHLFIVATDGLVTQPRGRQLF